MCNPTDTSSPPIDEPPMHRYLAELERLPDGSLRISLYRNGEPIHREWARNQRTGRRRIIDLICSAVDADPPTTCTKLSPRSTARQVRPKLA